jgi:hypothetical protein
LSTPTNQKLSEAAQQKLRGLLEDGHSKRGAAKRMGLSDSTVRKYHDAWIKDPKPQDERDATERFQELQHRYHQMIGWNGKLTPAKPAKKLGKEYRITTIGDVHVPAQDEASLTSIIRTTAPITDKLVDLGDSADNFNFSRYEKFKRPFTPLDELQRLQAYYILLSETYPEVDIMWGNHDARFIKWLVRLGVDPAVLEYLEYAAPGITYSPATRIIENLPNVSIVKPKTRDFAEFPFLHQIGDCVFSHAEKYSAIPNKAVGDVIQWLMSFGLHAGIVNPFKVVVQAHTHQAGMTHNDFGVLGIENGCVTQMPDYAGNARTLSRRMPVIGYSRIIQVDGVSDLEQTRFHCVRW